MNTVVFRRLNPIPPAKPLGLTNQCCASIRRDEKDPKSYKPPNRRTIRYLCLALFTTLLIFVLSLVRASWNSSRQLELGLVEKQPPKPPLWEDFPFLKRYFGGIRALVPREKNLPEYPSDDESTSILSNGSVKAQIDKAFPKSIPFDPYPDYKSPAFLAEYAEKYECFLDSRNSIRIPRVHYYTGIPQGQPEAVMGSHEVLGLRNDICFDRFGRLGPYGYGYSLKRGGTGAGMNGDREGADEMWKGAGKPQEVDYRRVNWAEAQKVCSEKNSRRFASPATENKSAGDDFLGEGVRDWSWSTSQICDGEERQLFGAFESCVDEG